MQIEVEVHSTPSSCPEPARFTLCSLSAVFTPLMSFSLEVPLMVKLPEGGPRVPQEAVAPTFHLEPWLRHAVLPRQ